MQEDLSGRESCLTEGQSRPVPGGKNSSLVANSIKMYAACEEGFTQGTISLLGSRKES